MIGFTDILTDACLSVGVGVKALCDGYVHILSKGEVNKYVIGMNFDLNSGVNTMICNDKVATSSVLESLKMPNVKHHLVSKRIDSSMQSIEMYLRKYGRIVVKDNSGSCGKSVHLVEDVGDINSRIKDYFSGVTVIAISPYYDIDNEYRLVMFNNEVKLSYRKDRPNVIGDGVRTIRQLMFGNGFIHNIIGSDRIPLEGEKVYVDWRHNLCLGATAEVCDPPDGVLSIATDVYKRLHLDCASIDVVEHDSVLEVLGINSGIMLTHFASQSCSNYDTARSIYAEIIEHCFS